MNQKKSMPIKVAGERVSDDAEPDIMMTDDGFKIRLVLSLEEIAKYLSNGKSVLAETRIAVR